MSTLVHFRSKKPRAGSVCAYATGVAGEWAVEHVSAHGDHAARLGNYSGPDEAKAAAALWAKHLKAELQL